MAESVPKPESTRERADHVAELFRNHNRTLVRLLQYEERAAMRDRAKEQRQSQVGYADGESDVLKKIAEVPKPDRGMAERVHAIIKTNAPALSPRIWYGMPAYAKDGNVLCFFQSAQKLYRIPE